jgi:hypothetical protein
VKYHVAQPNPAYDGKPTGSSALQPAVVEQQQTFATDIFIPLLQNVLGGGAVAGLCGIAGLVLSQAAGRTPNLATLAVWCLMIGSAVTCTVTVIRFFGDDIGLVRFAYQRGQNSMRLRVNALELELQAARAQLAQVLGKTKAVPSTPALQQLERAYTAANHLIHWHFEDLPIDRRSCESRNMAQSDWRRARHLLLASGVMDGEGCAATTLPEALFKLQVHYQKLATLGGKTDRFVAPI